MLGKDRFLDQVLSNVLRPAVKRALRDILPKVCQVYGIEEAALKVPGQQRMPSEACAVLGWVARESGSASLTEAGRYVNRDVGTMSSSVRRLPARFPDEPDLQARVEKLQAGLLEAS